MKRVLECCYLPLKNCDILAVLESPWSNIRLATGWKAGYSICYLYLMPLSYGFIHGVKLTILIQTVCKSYM